MIFIHEDKEFPQLVRIVSAATKLSSGLVEKDYWVTHTLWALHAQGFEIWFKGGTSLSKGFRLIQRFSEDLDLRIDPGTCAGLQPVSNWKSQSKGSTKEREKYFKSLALKLTMKNAVAKLSAQQDEHWRNANIEVEYEGHFLKELDPWVKPYVLLEVGSARVTPFLECNLSSFVHDQLQKDKQLGSYEDNRPQEVRCVHPAVTLIEKLDALERKVMSEANDPPTFVRHFEDAARIIEGFHNFPLPPAYPSSKDLIAEMVNQKQIRKAPSADSAVFKPLSTARWQHVKDAYDKINNMYWGPRVTLDHSCEQIRKWLASVSA